MIMELVEFDRPNGFTDADLLDDARGTVDHWRANPDLIRKHFITDGPTVMGVYVWPSRAAAEVAHDAAWVARFRERTGVEPRIRYFDMFMVIDNVAGEVTEYA
ncbi:hypothetical protein [Aestuariivita sp.]|jgi:hypothetical protein|uniref:hypothetical protein n=1 Tax=Aestuariivita sp. TaxID=1872407 RepID=UPI0021734B85|nr:hypothetical protein [Aestuariivita sp.]MCE8008433.1 monooxygenase [Aestuariivita sp.]